MKRKNKYTIEEVKNYAKERNGECLSTEYKNNKTNLEWFCNICKSSWYNTFKNIKLLNNWCPYCSGKYNNNIENIKILAKERNGECLSTKYKNNKTNLEWFCNICLCVWYARLDRIKMGTWCPKCRESRGERIISKCLDKLNIKYIREKHIKNINCRFDFYINDFNIAIEYDGVQHFYCHNKYTPNEMILKEKQNKDIIKTLYCNKNKIKLLRICFKNLNTIHLYLEEYLQIIKENNNIYLYFTKWDEYNFIYEKLDKKIEFLIFLTEIGKYELANHILA